MSWHIHRYVSCTWITCNSFSRYHEQMQPSNLVGQRHGRHYKITKVFVLLQTQGVARSKRSEMKQMISINMAMFCKFKTQTLLLQPVLKYIPTPQKNIYQATLPRYQPFVRYTYLLPPHQPFFVSPSKKQPMTNNTPVLWTSNPLENLYQLPAVLYPASSMSWEQVALSVISPFQILMRSSLFTVSSCSEGSPGHFSR